MDEKKHSDLKFIYKDPDLMDDGQIEYKNSTFLKNLKHNTKFVYFIYGEVMLFTDLEQETDFYLR